MESIDGRPIFEEIEVNNYIVGAQLTDMTLKNNEIMKTAFTSSGDRSQITRSDLRNKIRRKRAAETSRREDQGEDFSDYIPTTPKAEHAIRDSKTYKTNEVTQGNEPGVDVMTGSQIKKIYKRRYPELEEEVFLPLIEPDEQLLPSQHIEVSFRLMNERERYQQPEIKKNLLDLARKHRETYELVRKANKKKNLERPVITKPKKEAEVIVLE